MSTFMGVVKDATGISRQCKEVLSNICSLWGLNCINKDIGNFLMVSRCCVLLVHWETVSLHLDLNIE